MEPTTKKGNGALVTSIIIIVVIVLLGIFLLGNQRTGPNQESVEISNESTSANSVSASDEITDIEADLNANGDIDSLDSGLE
jgi:flagellar basal body-associated protein FliL